MEIEFSRGKNREPKMKRNKRTDILAHEELSPLTEHILAQMGSEGDNIRKRLKKFYRKRNLKNQFPYKERLEDPA